MTYEEVFFLSDTSNLSLILAIHNHQPVGNFDHVLENAYKKAYLPFLKLLRKHPSLKIVLHYSGTLLSWIEKNHPEAIDILRGFVKEERVEFLSGGFYEPILSALPDEDKVMQIKEMTGYVTRLFDFRPKGMWLAERVWEPHMPGHLSSAGIEYLPLDDYHFKLSGLDDEDLSGYFITEESGSSVMVFPGSERLRYYIPFRGVDEVISYFREVCTKGGTHLLTMADDGEKFGVWPKTHKHCYEDGWLERFFSALEENSRWIKTTTFSEYRSSFRPAGTVYLPTASYREMGEWVLPPEKGLEYERALNEMQRLFGDRAKGMLRGGIWRSFLSKYPEANHIHKRMLMISNKVHEASKKFKVKKSKVKSQKSNPPLPPFAKGGSGGINSEPRTPDSMLHELWKGQCNDAYWHGIFGGLYLPHLRSSLFRHLINAESMAEEILDGGTGTERGCSTWKVEGDLDCDGFKDVCAGNCDMTAFFSERGGRLIELSLKKRPVNILDTLTRRHEAYHFRLSEAAEEPGQAKTIHERLNVKEAGISDYLIYDNYTRASLLDHFFGNNITLDSLMREEYEERGDFINGLYGINALKRGEALQIKLAREGEVSGKAVKVEKTVKFKASQMSADYVLEGDCSGIFGIEFNISLLGSPYASIGVKNKSLLIKDSGKHEGITEFSIKDDFLNLGFTFTFNEEISLWHYPVETVSLSEEGAERIYQGTAFLFMKGLDFNGNKRLGFSMDFREVN